MSLAARQDGYTVLKGTTTGGTTYNGGYTPGTTTGGTTYNGGYTPGTTGYSNGKKNEKAGPFAKFVLGVILICTALPMVWMNERRQVKIYKVITKARESCKESSADSVMDNHNFELVHTTGNLHTKIQCGDRVLNYFKYETVKIRRDVEVYQWVEREEKEGEQTKYFYDKKWTNVKHNQGIFEDPHARDFAPSNPDSWLL